jgi:hypothetical protein
MADKWSQFETPDTPVKGDKWSQYETPTPTTKSTTKEEPRWFEPGSKSEAAVRGFSQGATLGFGDEIQAALRAPFSDQTYSQLRDEQRAGNENSRVKQPLIYTGTNIVGGLPAAAASGGGGLAAQTGKTALLGATSGFGAASGSPTEQAEQAALSATIGGAIPVAGKAVGAGGKVISNFAEGKIPFASQVNKVISKIPGTAGYNAVKAGTEADAAAGAATAAKSAYEKQVTESALKRDMADVLKKTGGNPSELDDALAELAKRDAQRAVDTTAKLEAAALKRKQAADATVDANKKLIRTTVPKAAAGAVLGAGAAAATGQNPWTGAALGAGVGLGGQRMFNAPGAISSSAKVAGIIGEPAINNAGTKAVTQALTNMSIDNARMVKQKYEPRIQEAVDRGQPEYAATFQMLSSNPEFRAAQEVDTTEDKSSVDNAADDARYHQAISEEEKTSEE